jgi:L-fuculose-phosphate aldolase
MESLVPQYDAILLENHGVVTAGSDLITAYRHMETVEHFARVMLTAASLGGPRLLTKEEIQKLSALRPGTQDLPPQRSLEVLSSASGPNRFGIAQRMFRPLGAESGTSHLKRRRRRPA